MSRLDDAVDRALSGALNELGATIGTDNLAKILFEVHASFTFRVAAMVALDKDADDTGAVNAMHPDIMDALLMPQIAALPPDRQLKEFLADVETIAAKYKARKPDWTKENGTEG